jgi:hypothetical protein
MKTTPQIMAAKKAINELLKSRRCQKHGKSNKALRQQERVRLQRTEH